MNWTSRTGKQKLRKGDSGVSLAEMLISLFLLSTTLIMIANYVGLSFTTTKSNKEKDFATQKAIQIVNELRAYVESGSETPASMLDNFDDGETFNTILTTQRGVVDPDDPLSKNVLDSGNNWHYLRNVRVTALPTENPRDLRVVNIKLYRAEGGEAQKVLADVTTVIRTFITDYFPPSQVYDVYCVALENVPDWWVHMSALRPMIESSFIDLQSRNPGLEFRLHWISRMGYGRDKLYAPFLNLAGGPEAAVNWTFHYPGLIRVSDNFLYYDPMTFQSRLNVDGTMQNATSYALADQFNHAVRYPEELRIRAGRPQDTEVSYRELIERLNSSPEEFVNAIIINLHGELLPIPPIRNFSDAAKDPETDGTSFDNYYNGGSRQGIRVVTHPEKLEYQNTDDVTLRVYAYADRPLKQDPQANCFYNATGNVDAGDNVNIMDDMIVLRLPGIVINDTFTQGNTGDPDLSVSLIRGGAVSWWCHPANNDPNAPPIDMNTMYNYVNIPASTLNDRELTYSPATDWMCFRVFNVPDDGGTPEDETAAVICLYNTPLTCPQASGAYGAPAGNASGLDVNDRLYGLDYIPCPVHSDFIQDLTETSNNPKNTARWIITLKNRVIPDNDRLTVQTRITDRDVDVTSWNLLDGSGLAVNQTGESDNHPYNLSETYAWIGNATLPATERYQLIGDPRHNPYLDVKLRHGYNWYWIDNGAMPGYSGFDRADYGWSSHYVEVDYPRACNLVRSGLLQSGTLYTSMTGYTNYFIGLGGEVGADDANGFEDGIPVNGQPYQGYVGSYHRKDKQDGTRTIEEAANSGDAKWVGLTWLGETFPDTEYLANSVYQTNGNLSSSLFYQVKWNDLSHSAFGWCNKARTRKTGVHGPGTFFNAKGDSSGPFSHAFNQGASGTLQPEGEEMAGIFHFPLPTNFPAARPFNLDAPPHPPEWDMPEYTNVHNTNQFLSEYYTNATGKYSSALIQMQSATNTEMDLTTDDYCFVVANGLDKGVYSGEGYFTRFTFMSLIYGVLRSGVPGTDGRMHQIPRVEITEPSAADGLENPGVETVTWDTEWFRWDNKKYLDTYSEGFSESDTMIYALKYSPDDGATWRYVQDRSLTEAGERPDDAHECSSSSQETWNLTSATDYPQGNYLLRLEAFRELIPSHYSYHQRRVLIDRY